MDKWELVGRITYSPRKMTILKTLTRPMTPTQISKATKIKLSNTSDALKELAGMGLVQMMTPKEMKKGRLFFVTKKGKSILKLI